MLEFLVVITTLTVGILTGWWLRGTNAQWRSWRKSEGVPQTDNVLQQLRQLTQHVANDVDKHQVLMGQLNAELQSARDRRPEAVIGVVTKLIESNEQMQRQLSSAEQRLKSQERQIVTHATAARTDPLTRLANRRAFDHAIAEAYRSYVDQKTPATIMMIDIDHFKNLNDTYGHPAGDEVLSKLAAVLKECVPEGYQISRYGGEEFAIVFQDARFEAVDGIADKARQTIAECAFEFEGLELHVTVSGGLAQIQPGDDIASLIRRADESLYMSKEAGRNCAHFHDGSQFVLVGGTRDAQAELEARQHHDYENGISSPEVFATAVRCRLDELKHVGAPLSVLYLKIDDLEDVRNRFGDENSTAAQRALTLMLKAAMREMDHAARFEGDGLSLMLPGCSLRGAMTLAEKLRRATMQCELPRKHEHRQFTVSIGVAEALADESEEELLNRVRDSLTAAHLHGRDCTYVHDGLDCHLIGAGKSSLAI